MGFPFGPDMDVGRAWYPGWLWPSVPCPLKQFPAFIAFIIGWSLLANLAGRMHIHPIAVFAVWLIGFVWGCAYIMAGKYAADHLTKRWLQLMIGVVLVGGLLGLALS